MVDQIRIAELTQHSLSGTFEKNIPTFEHISPELYSGDENPFHLNLAVAEIGRVSANGLLYDEQLVQAIEMGLSDGMDGINGHIPEYDADSAFPLPVVYWVGAKRVGEVLWAKGYIPPSPMREHIRMKKAMNGKIGTSIYGLGVKEEISNKQYRLKEFQLEQLDLVQADRAALDMRKFPQAITAEMKKEEGLMPENTVITLNDVPETIREQIIAEARLKTDASRVAEMEAQLSDAHKKIAEMMEYGAIIGSIRALVGEGVDVSAYVQEMYSTLSTLRQTLGENVNISVAVEEMHRTVAEMKRATFDRAVTDTVAELTAWNVKTEAGKAKLASLRNMLKSAVIAQMGQSQDVNQIRETAQAVFTGDLQVIAETVRDSLSGGVAVVGAIAKTTARETSKELDDPKVLAEIKSAWNIS